MTVITSNEKITVPQSVRRKAGIKTGDRLEFVPSAGAITIRVKRQADDEYTRAERRAIDRGIAQSEKEYREGRSFGPFDTHEAFIASLHAESKKLGARKAKRRQR